jgi:hypothetical protein
VADSIIVQPIAPTMTVSGVGPTRSERRQQARKALLGQLGQQARLESAATVAVGSTTTGSPLGTSATVTNSGTYFSRRFLNFTIPQGATGAKGDTWRDRRSRFIRCYRRNSHRHQHRRLQHQRNSWHRPNCANHRSIAGHRAKHFTSWQSSTLQQ